jgi:hypothetical protein
LTRISRSHFQLTSSLKISQTCSELPSRFFFFTLHRQCFRDPLSTSQLHTCKLRSNFNIQSNELISFSVTFSLQPRRPR